MNKKTENPIGPTSLLNKVIVEARIKVHGMGALDQKLRALSELQAQFVRADELLRDVGAEKIRPLLAQLHEQLGEHLVEDVNRLYEDLAEQLVGDESAAVQGML